MLLSHWGSEKNGWQFADHIFKFIFLYENCYVWIQISPKFVPINNQPALVQKMAWHWPDNPLQGLMSPKFLLAQLPKLCIFCSAYLEYTSKLCSNPLAQLIALLAPGYWAICRALHYLNQCWWSLLGHIYTSLSLEGTDNTFQWKQLTKVWAGIWTAWACEGIRQDWFIYCMAMKDRLVGRRQL